MKTISMLQLLRSCATVVAFVAIFGQVPSSVRAVDWSTHGKDWVEGTCGLREYASPINFDTTVDAGLSARDPLRFKYTSASWGSLKKLVLKNDGGAVYVDVTASGGDVGGVQTPAGFFKLTRIDFKGKGEHQMRGKRAALEVQLIHENPAASAKVVIAAMLGDGSAPVAGTALLQSNATQAPHLSADDTKKLEWQFVDNVNPLGRAAEALEAKEHLDSDVVVQENERKRRFLYASKTRSRQHVLASTDMNTDGDAAAPTSYALLDLLLGADLPALDSTTEVELEDADGKPASPAVGVAAARAGNLFNVFLQGGEFMSYAGSATLPPCGKAMWYVRRNWVDAKNANLQPVIAKLDKFLIEDVSNNNGGNYRDLMPVNNRIIDIVRAAPLGLTPAEVDARVNSGVVRVFKGDQIAADAMTIAQAAANHAKEIDNRVTAASLGRKGVLTESALPATPKSPTELCAEDTQCTQLRNALTSAAGATVNVVTEKLAEAAKNAVTNVHAAR